ncbi:MAG: paraquat-inducible protein A [Planctomycetales bacterium]
MPLLRDDPRPVTYSLWTAIETWFSSSMTPVACLALLGFVVIPCLDTLLVLACRLMTESTRRLVDDWWAQARCWELLPVLLAGLALVASKNPDRGAVLTLNCGFYVIGMALIVRGIPHVVSGIVTGIRWLQNGQSLEKLVAGRNRGLPVCLSIAALATLVVGVLCPFFRIEERLEGGFLESAVEHVAQIGNTRLYSIVDGIRALWQHGEHGIATILVIASVLFPLSKIGALLWFLTSGRRSRAVYLRILKQVGPWSMLDAIVVALLAIAHVAFPGGSSFEIAWAFWVFVSSIGLNSLALMLTRYDHPSPQRSARASRPGWTAERRCTAPGGCG